MKTANEDRSSSAGQGRILAGGRKNGLIFWRERSLPPAFFIVFQKKRPPIENQNNQNSIRTGSFLLSVCCSFFVVSTFPSVACFRCRQPSLYRRERGKVFGLNTLCLQRKILPETARPPDLFTFNGVCTNFHGRRGNRRPRNGHWLSWPESVRFLRLFSISLSISSEILSSVTLA